VHFWPDTLSLSGDYGTHNAWINDILHGRLNFGYPPLVYWLSAGVTKIVGSSVVAMNIITIISLVTVLAGFLFIVSRTGVINATITVFIFFLIYLYLPNLPILGFEVVGNYFFSELVGTAYLVLGLLVFLLWRGVFEYKLVFSIIFLFVGYSIYPIPVLVFYGATAVFLFLEFSREGINKLCAWGLYVLVGAGLFLSNPSTLAIVKVAQNNGWLSFYLLTHSPVDIGKMGIAFIFFPLLLAGLVAIFLFKKGQKGIQDRAFVLINSVLLAVSGLAAFQFMLYKLGHSNPYSVKKYFFILGSFFLIELIYLLTRAIFFLLQKKGVWAKSPAVKQWTPIIIFAPLLVGVLYFHRGTDVRDLLKYETQAKFYQEVVGNNGSPTLARLNLPTTFNYLISTSDLEVPFNFAWQFCFANQIPDFKGNLMVDRNVDVSPAIWTGRDVKVVSNKDFTYQINRILPKVIWLFSEKQPFLISGFSDSEPWGTWSDGPSSKMSMIVDTNNDISLTFKVSPFLPKPGMRLTVSINANGTKVAEWAFQNGEAFPTDKTIRIPKSLIPSDGKLDLSFDYSKTNSPASLGINADSRQLALGFISMTRN
jgi:hypothetical protein